MNLETHTFHDAILLLRWSTPEGGAHRSSRQPGDDLSDLPEAVQAAAEALWTPEAVAAWQETHFPTPAPEDARAAFQSTVKAERWKRQCRTLFNGVWFTSDDVSATRLGTQIEVLKELSEGGQWTSEQTAGWLAEDGTAVPLTLAQMKALRMTAALRVQQLFAHETALMAAYDADGSADATADWPA